MAMGYPQRHAILGRFCLKAALEFTTLATKIWLRQRCGRPKADLRRLFPRCAAAFAFLMGL